MTIFAQTNGLRKTFPLRAIGTSYATLVPAQETPWTLESLLAANITALSDDFTLEIYDGVNATILVPAVTVTAKTTYQLINHHIVLGRDELLRVKSSAATSFDVTAVGLQANR